MKTQRPDPRTPLPDDVADELLREWGGDRLWPRLDSWSLDGDFLTYEVTVTCHNPEAQAHDILGSTWVTVTREDDDEAERPGGEQG